MAIINFCEQIECQYWNSHCGFKGNYCCMQDDEEIINELDDKVAYLSDRLEKVETLNHELIKLLKERINKDIEAWYIKVWFEHYNYWIEKVKKVLEKAEGLSDEIYNSFTWL